MIAINSNIAFALDSNGFIKEVYQYESLDDSDVKILTGLETGTFSEMWKIHPKTDYVFTQPNNILKPQYVNGQWVETATDEELGITIAQLQQKKMAQIRDAYYQTIAGGFSVTIGSNEYTFGWTTDDTAHMTATQTAVGKGFLAFPFNYADIHGMPVSIPDQATLDLIEETATKFNMNNHQQALSLIGQVQQATTPEGLNQINWTPATY